MNKVSDVWLGIGALFITNFIGGTFNSVLIKLGVKEIPPITFTMLRFFLATVIILPFYLRERNKRLIRENIKSIIAQSVFFAANVGIFSIAVQFTSAVMSQVLYLFIPIIVGILSYFLFKERFTKTKIIGSLVALSGVIFLLSESIAKADILTLGTLRGNLLIILGAFLFSGYLLLSQKLTKIYSAVTTSFFTFAMTFVLLAVVVPFELMVRPLQLDKITTLGVGSLLFISVFSSAVAYFLLQFGVKKTGAFTASLFQYIGPFFTAVSASIVLGEKISLSLIIGGLLIIFGVFYATTWQYIKRCVKL
jgi:drug/metabolite transporter (DMT)-like permease